MCGENEGERPYKIMFCPKLWTTQRARTWLKNNGLEPIKKGSIQNEYLTYTLKQKGHGQQIDIVLSDSLKIKCSIII